MWRLNAPDTRYARLLACTALVTVTGRPDPVLATQAEIGLLSETWRAGLIAASVSIVETFGRYRKGATDKEQEAYYSHHQLEWLRLTGDLIHIEPTE